MSHPPRRVGHHLQRPAGLTACLLVGPGGEQGPDQAGHESVPALIVGGRLLQFPPQQLRRQLRCPRGQRGRGLDEPGPGPGPARPSRGGQLLRDAQGIRVRGREFPRCLGVQRRTQRGRPQHLRRLGRHGAEPVGQHRGQRRRQPFPECGELGGGADFQRMLAHHGVDQLAHVQRIAGGLLGQLPQRSPGRQPEYRRHQGRHIGF
jgi:hypothetical protein